MSTPPTGPILPPLANLPASGSDSPVATWRVGQVLAATVVSTPQTGLSELRIGNLLVKAQSGTLNLSPGQTLRLEVASLKELPVLKLLTLMQQDPVAQALRNVLPRQEPLPPLFAALARISAGVPPGAPTAAQPGPLTGTPPGIQTAARAENQLAADITRLVRELFVRLPDTASVSRPGGLQQALRDSGLFLESKLTASTATQPMPAKGDELTRDFKANLLRLVQVLRENIANSAPASARGSPPNTAAPQGAATASATALQNQLAAALTNAAGSARLPAGTFTDPSAPLQRGQPPLPPPLAALAQLAKSGTPLTAQELLRHAEGALARVQLNQLSSLPQERQLPPEWLIELPVRRDNETDIWGLRISRDAERNKDSSQATAPGWTVMLAFDLPGLGPLQSRVNLRGDRVSAQFFSQTQGILPVISEHLPVLQARLQQAGLRVEELSCLHGQIPPPQPAPKTRILDERA